MPNEPFEVLPGYRIRKAQHGDLTSVCDIAKHAWQRIHENAAEIMGEEMHSVLCNDWEEKKAQAVRGHWERNPEWVRVVTSQDGIVVAFVTFRIDPEKSLGTILNNAVSPDYQARGIGTAMYEYVLNRFREEDIRYASVGTGLDSGHALARRAYEKVGFNIEQPHVTYYQEL